MKTPPRQITNCARRACRRRSADPKRAGWIWVEFAPAPLKTGWWCPQCVEGLKTVLAEQDIQPFTERLQ